MQPFLLIGLSLLPDSFLLNGVPGLLRPDLSLVFDHGHLLGVGLGRGELGGDESPVLVDEGSPRQHPGEVLVAERIELPLELVAQQIDELVDALDVEHLALDGGVGGLDVAELRLHGVRNDAESHITVLGDQLLEDVQALQQLLLLVRLLDVVEQTLYRFCGVLH